MTSFRVGSHVNLHGQALMYKKVTSFPRLESQLSYYILVHYEQPQSPQTHNYTMKTFITTPFSMASLVPATTANFDIYYNRARGVSGSAATGWVLFNAPPNCEQVYLSHFQPA